MCVRGYMLFAPFSRSLRLFLRTFRPALRGHLILDMACDAPPNGVTPPVRVRLWASRPGATVDGEVTYRKVQAMSKTRGFLTYCLRRSYLTWYLRDDFSAGGYPSLSTIFGL